MNYIFLDTTNLNIPNNYRFSVNLTDKITIRKYIRLVSATIPFDEFLINDNNNAFNINSTDY